MTQLIYKSLFKNWLLLFLIIFNYNICVKQITQTVFLYKIVDKTEMSIKHTAQDLPVIRDGEFNYLKIGTIIDEKIRKCAKKFGVYNDNDHVYSWIGSSDVPFSFVEKKM